MGSVGTKEVDISSYQWNVSKRYRDADEAKRNIEEALKYMTKHFGDISEHTGIIQIKSINNSGEMDYYGTREGIRATRFSTRYKIPSTDLGIHEFTHAITETIASQYKQLGYKDRQSVLDAIASDIRQEEGLSPKKWERKKWENRSEEYISNSLQGYYGNKPNDNAALTVLKKWWKKRK